MFFNLAHGREGSARKGQLRSLRAVYKWRSCRCAAAPSCNERDLLSRLVRAIDALILAAALLLPVPSPGVQQASPDEYREKANFLVVFPKFVEWPAEAFPSAQAPILICVFGDFSFGTLLAELTRGALIRGRQVETRWVRNEQALRSCHILFVSRSEGKRYAKIFKAILGASVLTVGETPDFMASGGAIDFLIEEDRLQFAVNIGAANNAHLRISSSMLALAHHVVAKNGGGEKLGWFMSEEIKRVTNKKIALGSEIMTSREIDLHEPAWNQAELLERVENDRQLVRELLTIFKEDFPRTIGSLEAAVSSGDLKKSGLLSHTLKGMLSNLGGARAAAAAARLEELASAGEIAGLRSGFDDLEREAGRLLPELAAYMAEVKS